MAWPSFNLFRDGLTSLMTGRGTTADRRTSDFWAFTPQNPQQIVAGYRSNWLASKIVDIPAEDMVREWRDWQADEAQTEALERAEADLGIIGKTQEAIAYGRLGGGVMMLGFGDDNPAAPAPANPQRNALRYVHVFSRWEMQAGPLIRDLTSPWFGEPSYYMLAGDASGVRVHPSRMIPFRGAMVPRMTGTREDDHFWGDSILNRVDQAIKDAIATTSGFASLVDEAKIDVYRLAGLSETLALADGEAKMMARLDAANNGKSSWRSLVLDKDDEWEQRQINWAGMRDLIEAMLSVAAAAADIPATRLLGRAPQGMNATGEGDERNYNIMIRSRQRLYLGPAMSRLDAALIPHALGTRPPEVSYAWAPLSMPTEREMAETNRIKAETVQIYAVNALVPQDVLEKSTRGMLSDDQWLPGFDKAYDEFDASGGGDDDDDPSAIVASEEGGDPRLAGGGRQGSMSPTRRAANDAATGIKEGDWVEFDSDRQTEKGPSSGKVVKVEGDDVTIAHSDDPGEVFSIAALKVKLKTEHHLGGTLWIFDATPRPLYVQRKLLNAAELIAWAKVNGFETTLPADDMHVTILYSRSPVDPMKMGRDWREDEQGRITVRPGGPRAIERLGENAVVLRFVSPDLEYRHRDMIEAGGSHDWPEYAPHVTLSYGVPEGVDLDAITPFNGALRFGPEIFAGLDLDWKAKVREE